MAGDARIFSEGNKLTYLTARLQPAHQRRNHGRDGFQITRCVGNCLACFGGQVFQHLSQGNHGGLA